jgi:cbb3-type cytochrome oxidase maturation protein
MNLVMVLIPLSLLLVGVAIWAFIWAVNSGQFDDLETPGWEILSEPTTGAPPTNTDAPPSTPLAER